MLIRDKLGRFMKRDRSLELFELNGKLSLPALLYLLSLYPASLEMLKLNSLPALVIYLIIFALPYFLTQKGD